MSGPFNLRYLHLFVTKRSGGAFILSRNGKTADLVGASHQDVAGAIMGHRGAGYRYFWFAYTGSAEEALHLQRTWYHRYRPSDNVPPPPGAGSQAWRCTTAGCAACALTPTSR